MIEKFSLLIVDPHRVSDDIRSYCKNDPILLGRLDVAAVLERYIGATDVVLLYDLKFGYH